MGVWIGVVLFLCFAYFLPHWDWNQNARLDMTVAIVNHRTFAIDRYQGNTGDKDFYRGHFYSSKAPGQSLIGVPIYLIYKTFVRLEGRSPADSADDLALQYVEIIATDGIPAVLSLLLFFWFLGYFSTSLANRTILTLTLGLGTNIFAYAQQLFAHVPVAGLLLAAFVLVYVLAHRDAVRGSWTARLRAHSGATAALAGFTLGTAVLLEYPPALIAALIGLYALLVLPFRLVVIMTLAAVPPLLVVMAYNYGVYGNPFVLGYTSGASVLFKGQQLQGFGGFAWPPNTDALYGTSISRYRGLLFLSPFLVLAIPGYLLWARQGGREWLLFIAIPCVFFFVMSMFSGWWSGLSVGPRYLIPILPFLALPIIFALDRAAAWSRDFAAPGLIWGPIAGLIAISIGNTWAQSISGTSTLLAPEINHDPLFTYNLPALAKGQIWLNRGMDLGLTGTASLVPLFALLAVWSVLVFAPVAWGRRRIAAKRRHRISA